MTIKKLAVSGFRNIRSAELEFSPTVNIFYGKNAQGKTNLLEAIAVVLGRNFRIARKEEYRPFTSTVDSAPTRIVASYETELVPDKVNKVEFTLTSTHINGLPLKKASELYGDFKFVSFTPDSLELIKGYADMRRYYLDNIAVAQHKAHRKAMQDFLKATKERSTAYYMESFHPLQDVWDDIIVKQGINITYGRMKFFTPIHRIAAEIYSALSGGEELEMFYGSTVYGNLHDFDITDKQYLYDTYKRLLADYPVGTDAWKTVGAHRDDVLFLINGKPARGFASQGQIRSLVVALKLAEAEIIRQYNRENPIILLDEVLGELDADRRKYLLANLVKSQMFITTCNPSELEDIPGAKLWYVSNGEFVEEGEL